MNRVNDIPCRAALLTPPGAGGVAVIRLAGSEAATVLRQIFRPVSGDLLDSITPQRVCLGQILDARADETLDQVIITADNKNQTAEIHCHGGNRVIQRIMMLLQRLGVKLCDWHEIMPHNSIGDEIAYRLPEAKTTLAVTSLASQHPGGLTAALQKLITELQTRPIPETLAHTQIEMSKLLATWPRASRLLTPSRVVLTGPANAGKSTLANALTGHTQSLTADLPGTTRDWTAQSLDINGLPIMLIDTAGLKDDYDTLENLAIKKTHEQLAQADLILLVVEAKHSREQITRWLSQLNLTADISNNTSQHTIPSPSLTIINKIDQSPPRSKNADDLHISALADRNFDHLKTAIAAKLGFDGFSPAAPLVFTDRQKQLLEQARDADSTQNALDRLNTLLGSQTDHKNSLQ